jgi:hypothetical protein
MASWENPFKNKISDTIDSISEYRHNRINWIREKRIKEMK